VYRGWYLERRLRKPTEHQSLVECIRFAVFVKAAVAGNNPAEVSIVIPMALDLLCSEYRKQTINKIVTMQKAQRLLFAEQLRRYPNW